VEIPVGPFALIRAVIQKNIRQTLSGHQLDVEAIEKNADTLRTLPVLALLSRKTAKAPPEVQIEPRLIFNPEMFPLLKYAFSPP
jgi:hypothetical protein